MSRLTGFEARGARGAQQRARVAMPSGPAQPVDLRSQARRRVLTFAAFVCLADAVVLAASFWLAYEIRTRLVLFGGLQPILHYAWVFAALTSVWLGLACASGLAEAGTYRTWWRPLLLTARVHLIAALILLSGLYLLKATDVSRLLTQMFLLVSAAGLVLERAAIGAIVRSQDTLNRRVLVIGTTPGAQELLRALQVQTRWDAYVVGLVATNDSDVAAVGDTLVVGHVTDIEMLLDTNVFDEVVMADSNVDPDLNDSILSACLERGLTYHTLVRMPNQSASRFPAERLAEGLYLVSLQSTRHDPVALVLKRMLDVLGACAGLIWFAATFVVVAPLIRLGSPGPVIFRQTRVGRNGRRFTLYKFRTMTVDAEERKAALITANEMSGHLFKLRRDPRVTPIGRFLRGTYLDELPQFWNVLKGDMSLVGTRPPTPDEVARYSPHHRRRLSFRPGITGLWQSMGNDKVWDFEVVVKLDCDYIDRWSIWLDLEILAKTCLVVLRGAGH